MFKRKKQIALGIIAGSLLSTMALLSIDNPKPDSKPTQKETTPTKQLPQEETNAPQAPPEINQPTLSDVRELSYEFASHFKREYTADRNEMENVGNYVVPSLKNGNIKLNNNPIVFDFTIKTGAYVTIYVKAGNDFVAIVSSFALENGLNARGMPLDRYSPAYRGLASGRGYGGEMILYGRKYVAQFEPIRNRQDQIIGGILVALPELEF